MSRRVPTPPDAKDRILAYLQGHPEGRSVVQIVVDLQLNESATRKLLHGLREGCLVEQDRSGQGHRTPNTWRAAE